jgi:hypothetical protein
MHVLLRVSLVVVVGWVFLQQPALSKVYYHIAPHQDCVSISNEELCNSSAFFNDSTSAGYADDLVALYGTGSATGGTCPANVISSDDYSACRLYYVCQQYSKDTSDTTNKEKCTHIMTNSKGIPCSYDAKSDGTPNECDIQSSSSTEHVFGTPDQGNNSYVDARFCDSSDCAILINPLYGDC